MHQRAGAGATDAVVRRIEAAGCGAHVFHGEERDVIAVLGAGPPDSVREDLIALAGVERVEATTRPFKLASRAVLPGGTTFPIGSARLGVGLLVVVGSARPRPAGELVQLARSAHDAGAGMFWAGRGSSGELRRDLLDALDEIRSTVGLPVLVDIWDTGEVDRLSRHADALQIPSSQMHDVPLIRAAGQGDRPIFVCRGPSATIEEWLMAGERILQEGNRRVALVEQGIRTFETAVQSTLDLNAVAVAHRLSHLPVLVNPSLAAGQAEIVPELSLAAAATAADGIMLDVHIGGQDDPSTTAQALPSDGLGDLIARLVRTRAAVTR
ncbi:MAG: N-acetylneuraminate synthase family protein [Chloroflexi bacterium]|nr:N-acetylneuraminate synthase family protein [Chloroflexota bacterium]